VGVAGGDMSGESAFSTLLCEARDRLRAVYRDTVGLHFDWDGSESPRAWAGWYMDPVTQTPKMHYGASGEQALRILVEQLRQRTPTIPPPSRVGSP
jgi:hypothetical protein